MLNKIHEALDYFIVMGKGLYLDGVIPSFSYT